MLAAALLARVTQKAAGREVAGVATERALVSLWVELKAVIAEVPLAATVLTADRRFVVVEAFLGGVPLLAAQRALRRVSNVLAQQPGRDHVALWVDLFRHLKARAEVADIVLCELLHLFFEVRKLFREVVRENEHVPDVIRCVRDKVIREGPLIPHFSSADVERSLHCLELFGGLNARERL